MRVLGWIRFQSLLKACDVYNQIFSSSQGFRFSLSVLWEQLDREGIQTIQRPLPHFHWRIKAKLSLNHCVSTFSGTSHQWSNDNVCMGVVLHTGALGSTVILEKYSSLKVGETRVYKYNPILAQCLLLCSLPCWNMKTSKKTSSCL